MSTRRILVGASLASATLLVSVAAGLLSLRLRPPLPPAQLRPLAPADTGSWDASADDRTPEIRGHILDAEGNASAGAAVRLVSRSPPYSVYRDTKTDDKGAFSFAHVGGWSARVVADHGPDGVVTSAVLRALPGHTTEITLVLSAASAVRGTVVDAQGHAIAGAALSVEGAAWLVSAVSDAQGAFVLTTVPEEATSLVAVARGYRTGHTSLGMRSHTSEWVVRVVLTAASRVDGEVRDSDGNPVSASVVACEDQASEARTQSGADGAFQLPPSTIGCDVIAEHAEFAASDAAHVVEGRRLSLRLKAGGAIEGTVVDERGSAFSPFTVGVESFSPSRGRGLDRPASKNFDNPDGAFRWDKLAPGTYVLTASAPGRPPARSGSIDVRGGAVSGGVRIVLPPGGVLVGQVYDPAHRPIAGADLHFDSVSRVADSKAAAQTDAVGQYRLEGAPEGPFTARVHKDGFRLKLVSGLRVASGATLRQDVVLVAFDGGASMEFGGIGASLAQTSQGVVLQSVFADDPAARAGLRAGDRIVSIDGEPTEGLSITDALQRIRGEPGTSVGVSVQRPETAETLDLTIVRGSVVR